jgi:hypothetical protein
MQIQAVFFVNQTTLTEGKIQIAFHPAEVSQSEKAVNFLSIPGRQNPAPVNSQYKNSPPINRFLLAG